MLFETLATSGHEQLVFCNNPDAGLKAIVAVHSTVLGPALGGVRMRHYADEGDALHDVLRLSRTMTYKNALAGLNIGGGKAVILGDPKTAKTEVLFRAFGRAVEALGGRYITAEDVGTDVNDMEQIYWRPSTSPACTRYTAVPAIRPPFTAYGTLQGLMASMQRKLGHEEVGKTSIAIQGLGHIGMELTKLLKERVAKLFVADLDPALVQRAVAEYGAEAVSCADLYDAPVDVFAPCAIEGGIDEKALERLKVKIVCGSANNQLASHAIGDELHRRGILFAPDYAVNAGGVMNVSLEIDGYNRERAMRLIRSIYHNLGRIYDLSERENISPQYAADRIAEARLQAIGRLKLPMGRTRPRMGHLRGEH